MVGEVTVGDVDKLSDIDLKLLARGYARCWHDEDMAPRLRGWAWSLCLALTEELERRQEVLAALSADLDDGATGEQIA